MAQKQYLEAKVFSRKSFTPSVVRDQLLWLADFNDGSFALERCDVNEPLKVPFDRTDLEAPIRWLSHAGGEFKFKRSRPVKLTGVLRNRRFGDIMVRSDKTSEYRPYLPGVPDPKFVSTWTVWIESGQRVKLDADFLKRFLLGAFEVSAADFAFLTTQGDYNRTNRRVRLENWGTVEGFVGDDPEKGLPGLYWMNIFGRLYVDWFGANRISQIGATVRDVRADGSLFLQFGDGPDAESERTTEMQTAAKQLLGDDAFFDITRPDRLLRVPSFG